MWGLSDFVEHFGVFVSPEPLVVILIDALEVLEHHHRCGEIHGALEPGCVRISAQGKVSITGWGQPSRAATRFESPKLSRGQRPTPATDVYSMAAVVQSFFPDISRVHPRLRRIFARLLVDSHQGTWNLRSLMLDFLSEMGIEGKPFFTSSFIADPQGYNRALVLVLAEREFRRISVLNKQGHRRRALTELYFLLEIAPVNRRALTLWRAVKQGRRRFMAKVAYGMLIMAVLIVCTSVIAEKFKLISSGPKMLQIEPVENSVADEQQTYSDQHGERAPAIERLSARSSSMETNRELELTKSSYPLSVSEQQRVLKSGQCKVRLDLDADVRAYFDGAPGQVPARRDSDTVWLKPGVHAVTVTKPGLPPVVAQVAVSPDRFLELSGHLIFH